MTEHRERHVPAIVVALALLAGLGSGACTDSDRGESDRGASTRTGSSEHSVRTAAWTAWENGDVERARELAEALSAEDEASGLHLIFLCAFVSGSYEEALRAYEEIDSGPEVRSELEESVVEAFLHLGRFADAVAFARERKMEPGRITWLERRAASPLRTELPGTTTVPFASHQLTPYFPAFEAELEGADLLVHLDTGGSYLVMSPGRAESLGIELSAAGEGYHGPRRVPMSIGLAGTFRLGEALLENVPVITLASLAEQDFVIFGTNILQQFLSTLDYPMERLILSRRGDADAARSHWEGLPGERSEVPFYLWGDHYMFARGSLGGRPLSFFVDSGLVSLHPDGEGGLRQAAFMGSTANFAEWGYEPELLAKRVFPLREPLALGSLAQADHLAVIEDDPSWRSFGGVRIDGLISHAFLKRYAWTLDFDRRRYIFSRR